MSHESSNLAGQKTNNQNAMFPLYKPNQRNITKISAPQQFAVGYSYILFICNYPVNFLSCFKENTSSYLNTAKTNETNTNYTTTFISLRKVNILTTGNYFNRL
jgi:hypothetical protein